MAITFIAMCVAFIIFFVHYPRIGVASQEQHRRVMKWLFICLAAAIFGPVIA